MCIHSRHTHTLKLIALLLLPILYVKCDCTNKYIGRGEVTEAMIEDVKKSIEEYSKQHPQLDKNFVNTKFAPLLETLEKLQKGKETDISESIIDATVELEQFDTIQAFIQIVKRNTKNNKSCKLLFKLEVAKSIHKIQASTEALLKETQATSVEERLKDAHREAELKERRERMDKNIATIQQEVEQLWRDEEQEGGVRKRQYFIAATRQGNMRRIKGYIQDLKDDLSEISNSNRGFPDEQKKDAKFIFKRIAKEKQELEGALEDLDYFINHPGIDPLAKYTTADIELVKSLLKGLEEHKEEMHTILASKGENLSDYESNIS
ncbi:hypothetical protein Aasi_0417 [Candidatus Amoebophilus asiaticus 5a2]|uniref:Uncharacterized protein n=1 Tax=Amoebophilus asiaticus (strain 5a2) TaxID=452471 RepID=B3ERI1_AMOA5|nr:hypothetical protein [Candidatus Amoebophilus asiaticus]ACE05833.1 hypothetical protein Aasi_0417 [Candidatus Amoebophilus asiaticus 5a2]